ncbi:MAG TPA: glycosyltransferase family 39 protein, partial [Tepidisphaeraceae bacterium]|nr:glycosyltransferase family 39 protein [Tepidisphaeraceae bacterium]
MRWPYLLVLLLAILSFADIGHWPLHDPDEFNYITASREMVKTGDWVTPHFNGAPRLVKPILFYWIIAGAYKVFGVHVAVARLCSTAACAVGVLAVWLTARWLIGNAR